MQGRCKGKAPASFGLTEPMPDRACAILVKEDFLDAPLGTTCLLLDSLYVAVASPASGESSVLVLHVRSLLHPKSGVMCLEFEFSPGLLVA